jgi:nicotinamide-nucleotide amidase
MVTEEFLPLLRQELPLPEDFVCRTLKTTGLGESLLEERLMEPLKHLTQRGLDLGFCARVGEVDVRFVAHGPAAATMVAEAERIARDRAGDLIFGVNDDTLEKIIVREMTLRRRTLAIAESCTGGYITNRITDVPGASSVLLAGFVTYANSAKETFLGVDKKVLEEHGAVSEAVVKQMAEGARLRTGAHFGVATTGIAGPSGGSEEKPVGTVFLAIAGPDRTEAWKEFNRFDRETFKYVTAQQALARLLRRVRANV